MSNILDIGVIVVREERNVWVGLVVSVVGMTVYVVVVAGMLRSTPVEKVDWFPAMAWMIGLSIVASIVLTIVWGAIAEGRMPRGSHASDERDRDIARMGDRVGQTFMVIGGLGAIWLCAVDAAPFWFAHTVFAGFALSALVGGVARAVAYRRGLA